MSDLQTSGNPAVVGLAGFGLTIWYMMAHVIYAQVFGRDVLPVGKPWIK